jgi:hypothetical protein
MRLGLAAFGFLVAYIIAAGALTYVNVVIFRLADGKFLSDPLRGWLEIYWPLWTIFYAPAAVAALLAAWFSGLQGRAASWLLVFFLAVIGLTVEATYILDPRDGATWLLLETLLLASIFVVIAQTCRNWHTGR